MANNTDNRHNECLLKAADKHIEQIKCHLLRLEPVNGHQVEWQKAALSEIKEFQDGQMLGLKRVFL